MSLKGDTTITKAKSAGFCFGVNRAVNMVYSLLEENKKVSTFGPIIHNAEMVKELNSKGVIISNDVQSVPDDYTLVLRSHGVSRDIYNQIELNNINSVDATCPFVTKIHKIVLNQSKLGKIIFIIGDKNHPEVKAIQGHCLGECYTLNSYKELEELAENNKDLVDKDICMVAQTTYDVNQWKKCLKSAKKVYTNVDFFDTICSATSERQAEAKSLAEKSDLMIVIGDKNSSNSCKLFSICDEKTKTLFVQNADEIRIEDILNFKNIGVTAGASAPARIIKEVLDTMTDLLNTSGETTENAELELDFAQMLEENLKSFNNDGRVQGVVERITPNEVFVDVGRKQAGVVKIDELTNDPNAKIEDLVKIGDVLDLLIMRTNDQEGMITLSKKRVDAAKGWDTINAAEESQEILTGKVVEVIKGGVIVLSNGVRVFVPGSLATLNRNDSLDSLLKSEVSFRVIEIKKGRRGGTAVGSIRSVLKEENDKKLVDFWASCEVGKQYTGTVKSLASYGAFVDIGGIDGMIHISELAWSRIKHPSDVLSVGETVEVYVKAIDKEKGNISLGYKKTEDNPWEKMKNEYPEGSVVEAEIVGMTAFGAFAKILPGIDGLIHISQIANRRIDKPQDELSVGQKVQAKVTAIDFDKKRVSLSIRALLVNEVEEQSVELVDEVVATTEEPVAEVVEEDTTEE